MIAAMLLTLAVATAAAPQKFGTRQLEIPEPRGFVALADASPMFRDMAQAYLPPDNRLIEIYTTPEDHAVFAGGDAKDLERYLQLQTMRKADGQPISAADFSATAKELESGLQEAFASLDNQASQLTQQGNATFKEKNGVDPHIAAKDFGYLGAFRREPWGMFFAISTKVSIGTDTPKKMICAGALALIDHQLTYLYAYSAYNSAADRVWAQTAVSDWADAIHAANPDDPALEASAQPFFSHFDWSRVGIGAGIGALVGLVVSLMRRKRS
jgi:hypothetical protein